MSTAGLARILDRWSSPPEGEPDSGLLARFLATRDEDAFAALVQRHGALVYGTCRRILGDGHEADDAFQAVFFVLARRAATLRRDRGIGPWLHGVALRVAKKLRGQLVRRRLREMTAAKSERVEAAEPGRDFWEVIDEELARLSPPLREAILMCDLSGQSHADAAKSLGLAKGTITKRVAKAREQLAARLKHRGIALSAGVLGATLAAEAPASSLVPLMRETVGNAVAFSAGPAGGSATVRALAEGVLRSVKLRALRVWLLVGLLAMTLAGGGLMLAGNPATPADEPPKPKTDAKPDTVTAGTMWREFYTGEFQTSLPVSVAFSTDENTVLTGDTNGEVMALNLDRDTPTYRWMTQVGGTHAALAYSADRKHIYATSEYGVQIIEAATGKQLTRIEEKDSNPIAIGVFPNKSIEGGLTRMQIAFGNARGYFVKSWIEGRIPDSIGGIEVSTVAKDAKPADVAAVPLAVDPRGRSAIMTGLRDGTGQFTGVKGKNVLWAYVCGDYSEGSPGNRIMVGHTATVVCAAWAKEGSVAATGDADGRVIFWDAKTMKESRRIELGGRVLAITISDDGVHTAAFVRGKQGAQVYVWDTAKPADALRPIYTQIADFGGEPYASLSFSANGKRLAGCAIDKKWLPAKPRSFLPGQVHIWKFDAEPKAQAAPKHQYTHPLPKGSSTHFVILDNYTIITAGTKEGAIDLRDIRNGVPQARMVLGNFALGRFMLSSDRKWLAIEQHAVGNNVPALQFDVGVYEWPRMLKATVPSCTQTLAIASGGRAVAVVRENQIEVWDVAAGKKLKSAPFKHTRIDAAEFSPDGKLLAISDRNDLVLWRWEEDKDERIDLGRCVGSLAFSPDGKFLAEGPTPRENLQIRDVESRKVVQTWTNGTKQSMNVPRMRYVQGGRVLIGCDNIMLAKEIAVPHRINLWDTQSGTVAHQLALPGGLPLSIDTSPNGRYLAAMIEDETGLKLSVWRLDGETSANDAGPTAPASGRP
jgi:RNA polymerase sigma factor (sigma-70 family)